MSHSQRRNYKPAASSRYSKHPDYYDQDQYYNQNSNNNRASYYPSSSRSDHNDAYNDPRYSSQQSGTYGTYIWPLDESRRYMTDDPTKCRCNCCPHPTSVCKNHGEPNYKQPYSSKDSSYKPSKSRSHASSHIISSRHPRGQPSKDDSFVIDVVDNTDSSLSRKYGNAYPITLYKKDSVSRIVSFLAPDKRRAKVVVHWTDGEIEPFDDAVPLKELKKYGRYLEVRKQKKKRVHWA